MSAGRIVSIHEYLLKPNIEPDQFERAVLDASRRGLFDIPGLVEHRFVKGIRGERKGKYAAIWIYESREAWSSLWGPVDKPFGKGRYPENWRVWEDEVLAPLLAEDPDTIVFTTYEEFD